MTTFIVNRIRITLKLNYKGPIHQFRIFSMEGAKQLFSYNTLLAGNLDISQYIDKDHVIRVPVKILSYLKSIEFDGAEFHLTVKTFDLHQSTNLVSPKEITIKLFTETYNSLFLGKTCINLLCRLLKLDPPSIANKLEHFKMTDIHKKKICLLNCEAVALRSLQDINFTLYANDFYPIDITYIQDCLQKPDFQSNPQYKDMRIMLTCVRNLEKFEQGELSIEKLTNAILEAIQNSKEIFNRLNAVKDIPLRDVYVEAMVKATTVKEEPNAEFNSQIIQSLPSEIENPLFGVPGHTVRSSQDMDNENETVSLDTPQNQTQSQNGALFNISSSPADHRMLEKAPGNIYSQQEDHNADMPLSTTNQGLKRDYSKASLHSDSEDSEDGVFVDCNNEADIRFPNVSSQFENQLSTSNTTQVIQTNSSNNSKSQKISSLSSNGLSQFSQSQPALLSTSTQNIPLTSTTLSQPKLSYSSTESSGSSNTDSITIHGRFRDALPGNFNSLESLENNRLVLYIRDVIYSGPITLDMTFMDNIPCLEVVVINPRESMPKIFPSIIYNSISLSTSLSNRHLELRLQQHIENNTLIWKANNIKIYEDSNNNQQFSTSVGLQTTPTNSFKTKSANIKSTKFQNSTERMSTKIPSVEPTITKTEASLTNKIPLQSNTSSNMSRKYNIDTCSFSQLTLSRDFKFVKMLGLILFCDQGKGQYRTMGLTDFTKNENVYQHYYQPDSYLLDVTDFMLQQEIYRVNVFSNWFADFNNSLKIQFKQDYNQLTSSRFLGKSDNISDLGIVCYCSLRIKENYGKANIVSRKIEIVTENSIGSLIQEDHSLKEHLKRFYYNASKRLDMECVNICKENYERCFPLREQDGQIVIEPTLWRELR